jgi:ABC-type Mn2+/Zn2+ transport system ATPase subunit
VPAYFDWAALLNGTLTCCGPTAHVFVPEAIAQTYA